MDGSNTEQKSGHSIRVMLVSVSAANNKVHAGWRIEILDPRKSNKWEIVREIDEDELPAAEDMRNEQNRTNAPAMIRIVRQTHFS